MWLARIFVVFGGIYFAEGTRKCPDTTKAHLTRCDMYYKCETLPSDNYIWVPKNCPSGLIYDATYRKCVLPGDDWECDLGENDSSSSVADDENVYGVNNLSYLHKQMKGYDADSNYKISQEDEEGEQEDLSDDVVVDADDTVLIATTKDDETKIEFASKINQSSSGDFESSGDGEDNSNEDGDELENKSGYIPIPINSDPTGLLSSHLQRLSQLIKSVNNEHNKTMELSPDDLNQFLALHKIKVDHGNFYKYVTNAQAEPVPHNGIIDQQHLNQILDLQKKLNNFGFTRDTLSTTPSPIQFALSGNGAFPPDATTVHIKATNTLKNPRLPDTKPSTSQIIVNRPGGSVVFRLPSGNYQHNKNEGQISAETLKTLLELSKNMANQAPNTPTFVHSAPPQIQPIVQPILYNLPWHEFPFSSLLANLLQKNQVQKPQEENQSMEKISAVSGTIPTRNDASSEPDDIGPSTIIHNHIPITIAHPSPTNSIVNRYQVASTTARPVEPDRYDSYGTLVSHEDSNKNSYHSYPPFSYDTNKNTLTPSAPTITTSLTSFSTNPSPFSPPNYNQNDDQQPHYIQISQSRPDHYISPIYSNEMGISHARKPIPTFASIDGGYTQKFYTPSPHLSDNNVNSFVSVDRKPYPTLQPVNYVPITSASIQSPSYFGTSSATHIHQLQQHTQKHPNIIDKIDNLDDGMIDTSENLDQNYGGESNESDDEYTDSNLEQIGNDRNNENVMNILANYNSRIKPKPNLMDVSSSSIIDHSGEKKPIFQYKPAPTENHKQFVNLGGNFMSLETYQQAIEPYLGEGNSLLGSQIEVLTCATGVRQPNTTDCTRYFVCNSKTGKVLSYSCPPYTAFNPDTKICNAETYSRCYPDAIKATVASTNTKLAHQQAQQSIIEANRIKAEALKAQQLAQLIKVETDKILNQNRYKIRIQNDAKSTSLPLHPTRPSNVLSRPIKRPPNRRTQISVVQPKPVRQQNTATVQRPNKTTGQQQQPVQKIQGKRKIPCKSEGKLSDSLSTLHYFLCFKDKEGTMRARRMKCPANLTFCASTLLCTSAQRCMNKFNRL